MEQTFEIKIEKNNYEQPTEIRGEVVQMIINAFLGCNCDDVFHPFDQGFYRRETLYVCKERKLFADREFKNFDDEKKYEWFRIRGCEMKQAFKLLIEAGYYMFCHYYYGSWKGYFCSKRPVAEQGTRISSFEDFID